MKLLAIIKDDANTNITSSAILYYEIDWGE